MKTSTKIWMALAGILLIVLGVVCLCNPTETLFSLAWLIGILTLLTGISKLVFSIRTRGMLPNNGMRVLSGLLLIMLGVVFLGHKVFLTISLPILFAMWIFIEGIVIAVQSFDYKKVGFPSWWLILLFGIAGAVLGVFSLRNPDVTAKMLALLIGIGIIVLGIAHLVALCGVNKLEKAVLETLPEEE